MTATISRLFDDYSTATRAVAELEAAGIPHADISIVANNSDNWYSGDSSTTGTSGTAGTTTRTTTGMTAGRVDRDRDGTDDRAEGAGTGAGIGAALGGGAGLLAGLGLLAIPGLGPVVAAGWLASTALGALAGGAAGGLLGALTEAGVSEEDAHVYAEGVRRGGTLVTARVPDEQRARLEAILDRTAVNTRERAAAYRSSGWTSFDPSTPSYTAEQVRGERELYKVDAQGRKTSL